jgi:hypothetical protein
MVRIAFRESLIPLILKVLSFRDRNARKPELCGFRPPVTEESHANVNFIVFIVITRNRIRFTMGS